MKPLNFAVVGCGMLARQTHLPNLVALDDATLHTCCDINEANLAATEMFGPRKLTHDFRKAIEDPEVDAIILATTETFRVPVVEAAARAGKPVFTEKPLADTLAAALEIQRLVETSGIPFCVGHNRRCSPAMVDARETFVAHLREPAAAPWRYQREGWEKIPVGLDDASPVVSIRINDDWRSWKSVHTENELNRSAGLILSEGTHFADLATWFLDDEPISVFCAGQGLLNHAVIIRYRHGGLANIVMASTGSMAYPKELLEAIGGAAIVAVDHMLEVRTAGIASSPAVTRYPMLGDRHPDVGREGGLHGWLAKRGVACEEAALKGDPMLQFTAEPDKGHRRMLQEFIHEIRGERGPVCPVASAVVAARTCLAAAKSLQTGRTVELSEVESVQG